jgi:hypothetical protein
VSDTNPPPWRSSRPAISNSNSTIRTIRGDVADMRIKSSIRTAVGLNSATMRERSSGAGSAVGACSPSCGSGSRPARRRND